MLHSKSTQRAFLGITALLLVSSQFVRNADARGPVLTRAMALASGAGTRPIARADDSSSALGVVTTATQAALAALAPRVEETSHPEALPDAFRSYYAYRAAHPEETKPYLYFVDYGLPSTAPRGWVFDMQRLAVVEGPFTVAHGRGSAASHYGVPVFFSNALGSAATSLGLYVAQELYAFRGRASGHAYRSVGLRIEGVSDGFNDNARERKVGVHGAPYVTPKQAGLSEGCPAMEPARARRLLPKLAQGGLVFLFAPDERFLSTDRWLRAAM